MAKTTDIDLAEKISKRIDDILEKTGFTLLGLAVFSGIGQSAIKSYHSKSIPISVETVNKFCKLLSISLKDFFDFKSKIELQEKANEAVNSFKEANKEKIVEYFSNEKSNDVPVLGESTKKWEISMIDYIIHHTTFFETKRTTAELQEYLKTNHSMILTPTRIYNLLLKHIDVSLHQGKTNRINQDGSKSTQMVATYTKI